MNAAKHTPTRASVVAEFIVQYGAVLARGDDATLDALTASERLLRSHDALVAALIRGRAALAVAIKSNWEGATDEDVAKNIVVKQMDAALKAATVEA